MLIGSVSESETTVLLSSHLLADLERACDFLIVLQNSRVRLAGAVDDLLSAHRTLVGRRVEHDAADAIPGVGDVVRASHTDRQSTLLVRTDGRVDPSVWTEYEVGLEDLVLAYLAGSRSGAENADWKVAAR
jgi:ABC-2 type transport system ATP-binding protein